MAEKEKEKQSKLEKEYKQIDKRYFELAQNKSLHPHPKLRMLDCFFMVNFMVIYKFIASKEHIIKYIMNGLASRILK